jgi:hypothetical protein
MQPSETSSKEQPRSLRQIQRRTLLSKSSQSVASHSSYLVNSESTVFLEDPRKQTQFNTKFTDVRSVAIPSVDQRLLSDISDVFVKTKYATPQFTLTKEVNYSAIQEKGTVPTYLNNVTAKVPELLNDHTSLSLKSVLIPNRDPSQLVSSGISTITSSYSSHSESSAEDNTIPYPYKIQFPQSELLNPCHISEDSLCRNSEERKTQIAGSNSSSPTDLIATNSSDLLSFTSSASSNITGAQSEELLEHSTTQSSVEPLKLFHNEYITSSKISISESTLPSNSLLLSELTRHSDTSFENATVDPVNVFESPFGEPSLSEDETYWIYDRINSAESTPRTLTEAKPPALVRTNKRNTANVSSALSQRSVHVANGSSDHLERITVLGLFDMTTRTGERPEGRSELAAARLAVRHINEKHLLPGYQLDLVTNDTKVTSVI